MQVARAEVAREVAPSGSDVSASQAWDKAQARLNAMESMLKVHLRTLLLSAITGRSIGLPQNPVWLASQ